MLLCFDSEEPNTCRALRLKNDEYNDLQASNFHKVFEIISLANTTYQHTSTTIANYKGTH